MANKPQLLLHICCGPCASAVIERLIPQFDVTAFWHNPNIQPKQEHDRRLENARIVTRHFDLDLIVGPRDEGAWLDAVAGLEDEPEGGKRCDVCFNYRLRRTAREAAKRGIDYFTTTLTVSPYKGADRINTIGTRIAQTEPVEFLERNFKKRAGFQRSVELSRQLDLYRQNYCGCLFSRNNEA